MIFDEFPYVVRPVLTGDLRRDVQNLLEANGKPKTFEHVSSVSRVSVEIAARYGLDAHICEAAALLHDISAVIRPADMLAYVQARHLPLCEAEMKHNFLLHQRLSRVVAREYFGVTNEAILSPIECHTTLRENAAPGDMALFIADKLAWDQEGTPPFYDAVSGALQTSLEAASLAYMDYMVDHGLLLCPHVNWTAAHSWLKSIVQ